MMVLIPHKNTILSHNQFFVSLFGALLVFHGLENKHSVFHVGFFFPKVCYLGLGNLEDTPVSRERIDGDRLATPKFGGDL